MKLGSLIAGFAVLAIGMPAHSAPPIPLHDTGVPYAGAGPGVDSTQGQSPGYPPAAPFGVSPAPPPAMQNEIPPPAPSASQVWEPGHWSWNGFQYFWQPGRYVERPSVSASFVPGHWEQQPSGWVWIEGRWDYPGIGSSMPPAR